VNAITLLEDEDDDEDEYEVSRKADASIFADTPKRKCL